MDERVFCHFRVSPTGRKPSAQLWSEDNFKKDLSKISPKDPAKSWNQTQDPVMGCPACYCWANRSLWTGEVKWNKNENRDLFSHIWCRFSSKQDLLLLIMKSDHKGHYGCMLVYDLSNVLVSFFMQFYTKSNEKLSFEGWTPLYQLISRILAVFCQFWAKNAQDISLLHCCIGFSQDSKTSRHKMCITFLCGLGNNMWFMSYLHTYLYWRSVSKIEKKCLDTHQTEIHKRYAYL